MPNAIQFWLSFGNGAERLQLPVNPESIRIQSSHTYEDVTVSQLGEYTVIGDAKLWDFSFSSFFPRDYNSSYCEYETIPAPWDAVQTIETWMKSRRPIRLTITGTPINYAVTVRSFNIDAERGGEPGDIYYDLALKEYVFIDTKTVEVLGDTAKVKSESTRPTNREIPSSYTVKAGDNLTKIGLRFGKPWRDIYAKNTKVIGPDPNRIYPGQVLALA
ncbi:peptidoglycan-binding lysin domain-containing protein [Brevibacillus borstelensis AK1]|uniref:Peptidoglycan-binding lysin domain-containing protein n=1 Tax=Brevibacillus borstelensis AK1 TaxID=1300222 RepID=M8DEE3_9BACL|nr:LysM peptidoglycan-binding domain-containing protein [Brevibacillus borstelensis]EMT54709.1 peptidoglycan-binding lysin domain-containing protein [Brevibacillus borstelensis AK1]